MSQKNQIQIKEGIKVFKDKKTSARTIAIPFRLPDNSSAVLMVTRLKDEEWKPETTIKNLTINYV